MSLAKRIALILVLIGLVSVMNAQNYFPEKPKSFDIKFIKGKKVYVPIVDALPKALKDESVFKGLKLDKEIDAAYAKIWKEGYDNSFFDLLDFEILRFNEKKLKEAKDKTAVVLRLEKDFYENWNAYLVVMEPKYSIIASAPANGLILTHAEDISLLFNMLHYSMIKACNYYGDNAKSFYKGHKNKYKITMDEFSNDLKKRVLLIPKYSKKDMKNYKKINDKNEAFLKENWKLTSYKILKKDELAAKVKSEGFNGYYFRPFNLNTNNEKIVLKYFMVLRADNQAVLFDVRGGRDLRQGNLKYLQTALDEWLYYFMDGKKRKAYDLAKEKEAQQVQKSSKKGTSAKATKSTSSKSKNQPVKKAEGRANKKK